MFSKLSFKPAICLAIVLYSIQSYGQMDYSFVTVGCNRVAGGAPGVAGYQDSVANAPSTANVYQLNRLFDEVAALNPLPKYLFLTGDIVLGYGNDTAKLAQQLRGWRALFEAHPISTMAGIQLVALPGNHETQYKGPTTTLSYGTAEQTWLRVMAPYIRGNNGPAATGLVPGTDSLITDQSRLTYSFNVTVNGHVDHFVMINTDPVGRDWRVPYKWIANDLKTAKQNGARHIFSFGHKPGYATFYNQVDGLVGKGATLATSPYVAQRDSFWNAMEKYNAEAMFCAHNHIWEKQLPHIGKTWQVIAGNGGSPTDQRYDNPSSYFGWTLVKVNGDGTVNIESWGRDQNPALIGSGDKTTGNGYYLSVATLSGSNYLTTQRNAEDITWGKYNLSVLPAGITFNQNCTTGCSQTITITSNIAVYSFTGLPIGFTINPTSGYAGTSVFNISASTNYNPAANNFKLNIVGYYVSSSPGYSSSWIGSAGPISQVNIQQAASPTYAMSVWTAPGTTVLNWDDATGFAPNWTDGNMAIFQSTIAGINVNNNYLVNGIQVINPALVLTGTGVLTFNQSKSVITIPAVSSNMSIYNPITSSQPLVFVGGTDIGSVVNLYGANTLNGINVSGKMRLNINNNSFAGLGLISSAPNSVLRFSNLSGTPVTTITITSSFNLLGSATSLGATGGGATLIYTGKVSGTSDIWLGNDPTAAGGSATANTLFLAKSDYTGRTMLSGSGSPKIGINNAFPPATNFNFISAGGLDLNGFNQSADVLSVVGSGTIGIINSSSNPSILTVNSTKNSTFSRTITNNVGLVKMGTGALTLSAITSNTGGTTLAGGSLIINGSLAVANTLTGNSGTLLGTGSILGILNLNNSSVINAGSGIGSKGKFTLGTLNINQGSKMQFDISDVNTSPGVAQDYYICQGGLNFNATSVSKFTFDIASPSVNGFDNRSNYSWNVISLTGGSISNFDPTAIAVILSNFAPSLGGGAFILTTTSNALQLVFTPSPVDVSPPAATYVPVNGGSANLNVNPAITFSENILSISGITLDNTNISNAVILRLNNATGADVAFNASISGLVVTIAPVNPLLPGQVYYYGINANAVKDLAGNIATQPGVTFTVSNTAPTLTVSTTTSPLLNLTAGTTGISTGAIADPTDPGAIYGYDFVINDAETAASQLTFTGISSNQTVVPNANISVSGAGNIRNVKIAPVGVGYSTITVKVTDGVLNTIYTINYAASDVATPGMQSTNYYYHTGSQEASSAQALDANFMLVADDEDNVLRIYNRNASGLPVYTLDMSPNFATSGKNDNESSFRIGNKIYWNSSYSNTSSGGSDVNRRVLFLTSITGSGSTTGISFINKYKNLRTDLINWDNTNGSVLGFNAGAAAGVPSEVIYGFNIEGMELAPNNTDVFLGFRAPQLTSSNPTKALIVSVSGFETNFVNGSFPPSAFNYFYLDLGGRAIREIRKNANNEYLISAGPSGSLNPPVDVFRLYTWNGDPNTAPIERDCDLSSFYDSQGAYESIVELPATLAPTSKIQLLEDNGDTFFYNDGVEYKTQPNRNWYKFKSIYVTLGKYFQRISMPVISDIAPGSTVTSYILNATATSGLAVSYTVTSDPLNIVSIVSGNTLSFTGVGSVTVTGMQAGDGNYSSALGLSRSFLVGSAATITFNGLNMTVGGANVDLSALLISNSSGTKSFIINGSAASLSGNTLTAVSTGTVTVTGSVAATASYNAISKSVIINVFTVAGVIASIDPTITFADFTLTVGGTVDLNSLVQSNSTGARSFTTSGDAVTLSGTNLIAVKSGNAMITAMIASTPGFNAISKMAVVTVISDIQLSISEFETISFTLYPNPVVDGIVNFNIKISGSIYNAAGIEVRRFVKASQVNVSGLPKGVYLVRTKGNEFRKFVIE